MTVYDHIRGNQIRTAAILVLFPLALLLLTYVCVWLMILILDDGKTVANYYEYAAYFTFTVFPTIIVAAGIWICISLFFGDSMLMAFTKAEEIKNDKYPNIYRLVENTAIAAGLPCPKIYIIDDDSLNAFATGIRPAQASIALTRGIIGRLDRLELEAVIAHELAHIGNRDTRLMVTVVTGIAMFSVIGEILLHAVRLGRLSSGSKNANKGLLVIIIAGLAFVVFGVVIAPVIRCALSRRREYQADATAAKITRNPDGLAKALKKISDDPFVEVMDGCPMIGSMCIADPSHTLSISGLLAGIYATHPPVKSRIMMLRQMGAIS